MKANKVEFIGAKDHVIFEKDEILKDDGKPYTIFTPYSKKWKSLLNDFYLKSYPNKNYFNNFFSCDPLPILTLSDIGFKDFEFDFPKREIDLKIIKNYAEKRDFPALNQTTHLSLHLRFGTISIRKLSRVALENGKSWLNELIWRDFLNDNFSFSAFCK